MLSSEVKIVNGMVRTCDDYKRMTMSELQRKEREGYFELLSDPKPGFHVEVEYPGGKKELVFVELNKTNTTDKKRRGFIK